MNDPASPAKRRTLLRLLWGGGAALVASIAYPVAAYLKPPEVVGKSVSSVKVGAVDDFEPLSGTIFRFGDEPALLMRYEDGSFRAFSATCTHLDCTVQFKKEMGLIWCACHNGKYDLSGRNVAGPPPRPLTEYTVIVRDGEVHVTKS